MTSISDHEDLFDSVLLAENRFHTKGYHEGLMDGTRLGLVEGSSSGEAHGAKLSAEVSFYYGFAFTWKCLLQASSEAKTQKKLKAVKSLLQLIQKFPYDDPEYEDLEEDMQKVRAKFRQVCCLLNVVTDFQDYIGRTGQMSF